MRGAEVEEVFDLFDFWDGRDSMVDGYKVGDFLRCCGLNPTQALVLANGGTANVGTSFGGAAIRNIRRRCINLLLSLLSHNPPLS